ncbi:hypothetical protein Tcan_12818 [Toxocara canis]|uniref:Uncharacterized protein n=1 Tax=Toxocara canis TaxID=6265 RepID=A0A0B2UT72_TOXCA|nr:hypothetical protein Tcan_12818 [Toxocara canis]
MTPNIGELRRNICGKEINQTEASAAYSSAVLYMTAKQLAAISAFFKILCNGAYRGSADLREDRSTEPRDEGKAKFDISAPGLPYNLFTHFGQNLVPNRVVCYDWCRGLDIRRVEESKTSPGQFVTTT